MTSAELKAEFAYRLAELRATWTDGRRDTFPKETATCYAQVVEDMAPLYHDHINDIETPRRTAP